MNAESDGPDRRAAVEQFADALLGAVERVVDPGGERIEGALNALRHRVIEFVRRYHRLQIDVEAGALDEPVLFVANHGFGGVVDLNVMAVGAVVEDLKLTRPVTFLTHQLAWTLGVGPIVEHLGARPASRESAHEAFAEGHHVVVFPGGDVDAAKKFNNIDVFAGGNDDQLYGSIYHYQRKNGEEVTLHPSEMHPEYVNPPDRNPGELSCQERAEIEGGTQLLAVNMGVAAWLLARAHKTIFEEQEDSESEIYFDMAVGLSQPFDRRVDAPVDANV